jgi:nucleoside-diphosphate-sugar epimerase
MTILILGGCGFIGSNLAKHFADKGGQVIIIDGLLDKTGGNLRNIAAFANKVEFYPESIENIQHLDKIIERSDVIIDCLAWTSHHGALLDPMYDIKLNLQSHLPLLNQHQHLKNKLIVYIGSRGQYGMGQTQPIDESLPMLPNDVQGINKLAAEHYFRVYSDLYQLNVVSLRIPNCFGENQPLQNDLGLVGLFITQSLNNEEIVVFDVNRKRNFLYVDDLCQICDKIISLGLTGFNPFVVAGKNLVISSLVEEIIKITKTGSVRVIESNHNNTKIDIGNSEIRDDKLCSLIHYSNTPLEIALTRTINYFKNHTNDLAL